MTALERLEEIPRPPRPLAVMVPELVMTALEALEWIPIAPWPLAVMVPELVMAALPPLEMIPLPLVAMHPLLVTVSPIVVDVTVDVMHDGCATADVLRPPMRAAGESSRTRPGHNRCGLDTCSAMPRRSPKKLLQPFETARTRPRERALPAKIGFGIYRSHATKKRNTCNIKIDSRHN